jgi:hypothetical protein
MGHERLAISLLAATLNSAALLLHRGGFVGRLYRAKPHGFAGELVDVPDDRLRQFGLSGHVGSIGREACKFNPACNPPLPLRAPVHRRIAIRVYVRIKLAAPPPSPLGSDIKKPPPGVRGGREGAREKT